MIIDLILLALVVALAVLSLLYWGRRTKERHGTEVPPGFEPTGEVSIDPVDGRRLVVYYNPKTGDRFYVEERP